MLFQAIHRHYQTTFERRSFINGKFLPIILQVAFNSRSKVYQTWQNAIHDLQKKKANYEKTRAQGKLTSERLSFSLAQLAEVI